MKKFVMFVLVMGITLIVTISCTQAASEPPTMPMSTEEMEEGMDHKMEDGEMEHKQEEKGMEHGEEAHQAGHGGFVGMAMDATHDGTDFHLELVSDAPGQYRLYLSNNNREPVSPEGYEGTLAIIRPDGSEIASMPWQVMGDHLLAEGGPGDASQLDVRIAIEGPDLKDMLEMEFTVLYRE